MGSNYNYVNLFPTVVHVLEVSNFGDIKQQLIDFTYECKKEKEGRVVSNIGGWQSDLMGFDDDVIDRVLLDTIPSLPIKQTSAKLTKWININGPGSYNKRHHHPQCHLSGVFWIKCPSKCGDLTFDSPFNFLSFDEMNNYKDEFKEKNYIYEDYTLFPQEGAIVVFPSHILHEVGANLSKDDRISVAFNLTFDA